jgi:hypothetical protein
VIEAIETILAKQPPTTITTMPDPAQPAKVKAPETTAYYEFFPIRTKRPVHTPTALDTLLPVTTDAYGLGQNSDASGRPHIYRTRDAQPLPGIFTDGIQRDAYGLGVHMDQFGRPVYDSQP